MSFISVADLGVVSRLVHELSHRICSLVQKGPGLDVRLGKGCSQQERRYKNRFCVNRSHFKATRSWFSRQWPWVQDPYPCSIERRKPGTSAGIQARDGLKA